MLSRGDNCPRLYQIEWVDDDCTEHKDPSQERPGRGW